MRLASLRTAIISSTLGLVIFLVSAPAFSAGRLRFHTGFENGVYISGNSDDIKGRKNGKGVYTSPDGEVKLPHPHYLKPESDWPAAEWYDYTIVLHSGPTVGVAVLDHPDNPPMTWHNLAPIAMVNPTIVSPGPVTVEKGQPLRLRYRLVVHDGPTPVELLKKLSGEWRRR